MSETLKDFEQGPQGLATPPRRLPGVRWQTPPPDVAIPIEPADARERAAGLIGGHIAEQLAAGRSLYCIVGDPLVVDHIGSFDGRALPAAMIPGGVR